MRVEDYERLMVEVGRDGRPFQETVFVVPTKQLPGQGPVSRLVYNRAQRMVHEVLMGMRAEGLPPRVIVLKARQPGISTKAVADVLTTALSRPHSVSMIITHVDDATVQMFRKLKFMLQHLPPDLRPTIKSDRREELSIGSMPCDDGEVLLDTTIVTGSATGRELWRGLTLQCVHLSEYAQFPQPNEVLLGVLQAVPVHAMTQVVIESTARGMGDMFHQEWLRAVEGESGFRPVFIPWWVIPEYSLPSPPDLLSTLDPEEQELIARHNVLPDQLAWRRWCIKANCHGDVDLFRQEYPGTAEEAFLVTGRPAFPVDKLRSFLVSSSESQSEAVTGRIVLIDTLTPSFIPDPNGELTIYRQPEDHCDYTIGADPASGLPDGDFSCAQVFDRVRCEQVAVWHGRLAPIPFAHVLIALGRYYKNALIAPELTGGHGYAIIEELKQTNYPRIYVWQRVDRVRNSYMNYYGWETSARTRVLLIDSLHEAIASSSITLRHPPTIRELLEFQYVNRFRAEGLKHDDLAMALMIAYRVHLETPLLATGLPPRFVDITPKPPKPEIVPPFPAGWVEPDLPSSERLGFLGILDEDDENWSNSNIPPDAY